MREAARSMRRWKQSRRGSEQHIALRALAFSVSRTITPAFAKVGVGDRIHRRDDIHVAGDGLIHVAELIGRAPDVDTGGRNRERAGVVCGRTRNRGAPMSIVLNGAGKDSARPTPATCAEVVRMPSLWLVTAIPT